MLDRAQRNIESYVVKYRLSASTWNDSRTEDTCLLDKRDCPLTSREACAN